jgi:phage baseplate assembly protein gpV
VSVDGDTIVIGAYGDDPNGDVDSRRWSGSAYVFTRDPTSGWTQRAKLTAADGADVEAQSYFGMHLSLDGDTIVIAAHAKHSGATGAIADTGAAYVFTRDTPGDLTSGWTYRTKLTASDAAEQDRLGGGGVSLDGDTVVIGAKGDDAYKGAAYVFTRITPGDLTSGWTQRAKLTAGADGAAGDQFGYVSIDGDTIVIGSQLKNGNTGAAYVFTRSTPGNLASGWTQRAKLTAGADGAGGDRFGSVSIDGDTIVIGAYGEYAFEGGAYVFTRDTPGNLASSWTQVDKLTAGADGAADDYFGYIVSLDGDTMVIGSHGDDGENDNAVNSGSVYVFTTPPPPPPCTCCERSLKLYGFSVGAHDCAL